MAADAASMMNLNEFAETASYNGMAVSAVFERGEDRQVGNSIGADIAASTSRVWVLSSDVPNPMPMDEIADENGVIWQVLRTLESGCGVSCLDLVAKEARLWGR